MLKVSLLEKKLHNSTNILLTFQSIIAIFADYTLKFNVMRKKKTTHYSISRFYLCTSVIIWRRIALASYVSEVAEEINTIILIGMAMINDRSIYSQRSF